MQKKICEPCIEDALRYILHKHFSFHSSSLTPLAFTPDLQGVLITFLPRLSTSPSIFILTTHCYCEALEKCPFMEELVSFPPIHKGHFYLESTVSPLCLCTFPCSPVLHPWVSVITPFTASLDLCFLLLWVVGPHLN